MDIDGSPGSHKESCTINSWVDVVGCHPVEVRKEDAAVFFIAEAIGQLQIVQRDRPVHEFRRFHGPPISMKRRFRTVISSSGGPMPTKYDAAVLTGPTAYAS